MKLKQGNVLTFTLIRPEQLSDPVLLSSATNPAYAVRWNGEVDVPSSDFHKSSMDGGPWEPIHVALWSDEPGPLAAGDVDVYRVKVLVTTRNIHNNVRLFVTLTEIRVANPKEDGALIETITTLADPVAGPILMTNGVAFEPTIAGDGRLLVMRIGSQNMSWTEPDSGTQHIGVGADIVYSYYTTGVTADPTKWTNLIPVSHAHHDSRVSQKFGFAMFPLRDAAGTLIPDGEDLGASYPWIDHAAKNLFFTTISDQLHTGPSDGSHDRYASKAVTMRDDWTANDENELTRGVAFAGLWSHGKIILLDNLLNDMDYAVGNPHPDGPKQRLVTLFQAETDIPDSGELWLGFGRTNVGTPIGENTNTTIIDSLENKLNYQRNIRPQRFNDVVWNMSNGKHTDQLAFDDYLDPDALIVASMAGLVTFVDRPGNTLNATDHHTSWVATTVPPGFSPATQPIRLQNAATAPDTRWIVPTSGRVIGPGRIEPAATGGIQGKGFWLDDRLEVRFDVPATQPDPSRFDATDWYVGLFVDCRFDDDESQRRLLRFTDDSELRLDGRNQVLFVDASGDVAHRATIPTRSLTNGPLQDLLPNRGWAHLALQIQAGGKQVTLLLNGLPLSRWQHWGKVLFRIFPGGSIAIGNADPDQPAYFRGWIDEFKVLAHGVDPESAANHAFGTLIGLEASDPSIWNSEFAARYPAWVHAELSEILGNSGESVDDLYACYHDYHNDNAIHTANVPAAHKRASFLFPEGPLYHDAPRPASSTNAFCLTCHNNDVAQGGLTLKALTLGDQPAKFDTRRQPNQPPPLLFGSVPRHHVEGPNGAVEPQISETHNTGKWIDEWLLPSLVPPMVMSFTLVDSLTKQDLIELRDNDVVDLARFGASLVTIRANLDSAQGPVSMAINNGPQNLRNEPPYAVFGTPADPLAGSTLTSGTYNVTASPTGGAAAAVTFIVPPSSVRVIANYGDDFQAGSPRSGWFYAWSPVSGTNLPAGFAAMHWNSRAQTGGYHPQMNGPVYPELNGQANRALLHATGGSPGAGSQQNADARQVLAGYRVPQTGYYAVDNLFVNVPNPNGDGISVRVFTFSGGTMTLHSRSFHNGGSTIVQANGSYQLAANDIVWLAVEPNQTDSGDAFFWNFDILYSEQPF